MPDDSLALSVWVRRGSLMVRRDALSVTDPESWPTKWHEKFGDLEGFPWRKIYGNAATDARLTWARAMHRKNKDIEYCPSCGYQLW